MNSHDRPILDQLREDAERDAVLGVVERRHQDGSVRDVKVRIARGEALALEVERRRHRQIDHIDLGPVFESQDRKSTRLNSSHTVISYAVFCLKKKKHKPTHDTASYEHAKA